MHSTRAVTQLGLNHTHELGSQTCALKIWVHGNTANLRRCFVVRNSGIGSKVTGLIPAADVMVVSIFAVDLLDCSDLLTDHENQVPKTHDLVELVETQIVKSMGCESECGHGHRRMLSGSLLESISIPFKGRFSLPRRPRSNRLEAMKPLWIVALFALAASIGSLLALRPGQRERSTWFFLMVTAGLAGFPVFALGYSLGWWGRAPESGWAAASTVVQLPGEHRAALAPKDCPEGAFLEDRVGPQGRVQRCRLGSEVHGAHRSWRHDGILSVDCHWSEGRRDGSCSRWYLRPGRNLVVNLHQGMWQDGQRSGLHVDRFRTGRLHYEAFFLRGRPRGRVVLFGPAGQRMARLRFDADGPAGRWLRWHRRTGVLLSEGHFEKGMLAGTWRVMDDDRGQPWLEASFEDGALNGPYVEWSPWGTKVLEARYLQGKLQGSYRLYHDESTQLWVEGGFEGGQAVGLWQVWDRRGDPLTQCDFTKEPPVTSQWCFGRSPWISGQEPIDVLLERQADWVRVAKGTPVDQPLDAYDFYYGFPDWSPL